MFSFSHGFKEPLSKVFQPLQEKVWLSTKGKKIFMNAFYEKEIWLKAGEQKVYFKRLTWLSCASRSPPEKFRIVYSSVFALRPIRPETRLQQASLKFNFR